MIILLQYLIREIPEEERKIPGLVAGTIDSVLTFIMVKYVLMVI